MQIFSSWTTNMFLVLSLGMVTLLLCLIPIQSLSLRPLSVVFSTTLEKINGSTYRDTKETEKIDVVDGNIDIDNDVYRIVNAGIESNDKKEKNIIEMWPGFAGETALRQVQAIASKVSESTDAADESKYSLDTRLRRTGVTTVPFNARSSDNDNGAGVSRSSSNGPVRRFKRRIQRAGKKQNGGVFNNAEYNMMARKDSDNSNSYSVVDDDKSSVSRPKEVSSSSKREEQVWTALANLELDSKYYYYMPKVWSAGWMINQGVV
jgi:hypothetical protein